MKTHALDHPVTLVAFRVHRAIGRRFAAGAASRLMPQASGLGPLMLVLSAVVGLGLLSYLASVCLDRQIEVVALVVLVAGACVDALPRARSRRAATAGTNHG